MKLGSSEMEKKLIELLDEIIKSIKNDKKAKTQIEKVKQDLENLPKDKKAKKRVIEFFKKLGDSKSNLNKTFKGAGIAKEVISELIKLWNKL
jgi:hypothetical protein